MLSSLVFLAAVTMTAANTPQQSCRITAYAPAGTYRASTLRGDPGLVLSGGGLSQMPHAPVFSFIRERVKAPQGVRAGNLLILKHSEGRDYSDDFYKQSRLASVREVYIPPCASRAEVNRAAAYVDKADAVLFAGGDQSHYVAWKGSALIAAVKRLYARGGVEGGGSAGLAIQGELVYDAVGADKVLPDDEDLQTKQAVRNPYQPAVTFTSNFFSWPQLRDTITDTHVARRDRFGRLAAFMARAAKERLMGSSRVNGLAVDEGVVMLVRSDGWGTIYVRPHMDDGYVPKGVLVVSGGGAGRIAPGTPLRYSVWVRHLARTGARYNFFSKTGTGAVYTVLVDGSRTPPYVPSNPWK